jgi:hypothetical protein
VVIPILMKKIVFLCFGILLVGVILYLQRSGEASMTKQILLEVCHTIKDGAVKLYHHARSVLS